MDPTVSAVISVIGAILAAVFLVLNFSRNKSGDNTHLENRLTRIETDILYIRQSLDEMKEFNKKVDERLTKTENAVALLEMRVSALEEKDKRD